MIISISPLRRPALILAALAALAGCAGESGSPTARISSASVPPEYQARVDELEPEVTIPAVSPRFLTERNRRRWVNYDGPEPVNSIVIDPYARVAYHIKEPGRAMRMGIAVGKAGRGFSGSATIRRKEVFPGWTPTANMIRSEPDLYGPLSGGLPGGLDNPLGARALYLYRGNRDTMYRLHGTMDPSSIGRATSAGCIRFFNQDIMDMFDETEIGTVVKVRSRAESLAMEGEMVELNSGYVVPASDIEAIEADAAAYEAGQIQSWAEEEAESHERAVDAAEVAGSGGVLATDPPQLSTSGGLETMQPVSVSSTAARRARDTALSGL